MSSLIMILDEKDQVQRLPEDGILVPKRLVKALGLKVGDYVDIKSYFPSAKRTKIKISGISEQYLGLGVDMNINNLSSLLGSDQIYTGAVVALSSSSPSDIETIKNNLYSLPIVDTVEFREEAQKTMENYLKVFTSFSFVIILLAAIMSIAVIYNITVINIYEKKRELSSLKVMGFTKKEIRSSVYDENLVVGIISLIIGLPLGHLLSEYILGYFYTTDAYAFPIVTYISSYAYTIVLIFIFILMAQVLLRRKIDRIDMVEVLKVRE
jgi:putative ABC transport system permease protein